MQKRKAEKELYDKQRTVQIQNDEIERLKIELKAILRQSVEMQDRLAQTESIYTSRIFEMKHQLSMLPTRISHKRSQLIRKHTQALNDCRTLHHNLLERIRRKYERKLSQLAESTLNTTEIEPDELVDSIDSTRSKIAELLHVKSEKQELRIRDKLSRLSMQVEGDRKRSKQLQASIDHLRSELEQAKAISASKTIAMTLEVPAIDTSREEESLLLAKANMVSEETMFRQECHQALEKLRAEIVEKQALAHRLRKNIRESRTDDSEPLQRATDELAQLEQAHENLIQQRKEREELSVAGKVRTERKRQQGLVKQIIETREALEEAKLEYKTLMTELKRLDFMVYGRRGKYQIQM